MRIGIYGGTFNPIHLGHLVAAKSVFMALALDKIIFVPAGDPPHKTLADGTPNLSRRYELTRLAVDQLGLGDKAEVSDIEMQREGKSYTVDTLAAFRAMYPQDELWLLMGTDMFLTFQNWREPERILSYAGIAAFGRTEKESEELFAIQREHLAKTYDGARIFTMTIPGVVDISSTALRESLQNGGGEKYLAPAVYGYILREKLYGTNADLKKLPIDALRPIALSFLKHKRIAHVLGTEEEAIRLAKMYGADVENARIAALLHDCTKKLDMAEQLELCAKYAVELDPLEQKALKLLHAKTGAEIARDLFGVNDEVYEAIKWHTTGKADMTLLEKVIYLADYIEPNRDFPGVDELRKCVYENLDKGLLMGLEMTVEEMKERGNEVHFRTLEALNFLKG